MFLKRYIMLFLSFITCLIFSHGTIRIIHSIKKIIHGNIGRIAQAIDNTIKNTHKTSLR